MHSIFTNRMNVKFVVILREPIARAISAFGHHNPSAKDNTPEAFEATMAQLLKLHAQHGHELTITYPGCAMSERSQLGLPREFIPESVSYLQRGLYADQFRAYMCAGFRPEQFLIFFTNELSNITSILHRVQHFLGNPAPPNIPDATPHNNHKAMHEDISQAMRQRLTQFFRLHVLDLTTLLTSFRFQVDHRAMEEEFKSYLSHQDNHQD